MIEDGRQKINKPPYLSTAPCFLFLPRDSMLARYAVVVCLPACLTVCPFQTGKGKR